MRGRLSSPLFRLCFGALVGCSASGEGRTSPDTRADTGAFHGDTASTAPFDECEGRIGDRREEVRLGQTVGQLGPPRTYGDSLLTIRNQDDLDHLWEENGLSSALTEPTVDFSSAQIAVFVGWNENTCEGSESLSGFFEDSQTSGALVAKVKVENTDSGCDCASDDVVEIWQTEIADISTCFFGVR